MTDVAREKARHGMAREALADVLLDRAMWAHARLSAGRQRGVDLHEETITQDLLLDMACALPDLHLKTFTRAQEARIGGDWQWDWWFGGHRWFGLRLQAKRLKRIRRNQFGYDLGYRVGQLRKRQIDILTDGARCDGVDAAYVLYNGPDLSLSFKWMCRRLPVSAPFFGVSILPADVALKLADANTRDIDTVASHSRPWSCLATCHASGGCFGSYGPQSAHDRPAGMEEDLAEQVAASFYRIAMRPPTEGWSPRHEQRLLERVRVATSPDRGRYIHRLLDVGDLDLAGVRRQVMAVTIFDATRRPA